MADKVTNSNTNILPNNPMKSHDLLEHLKKVKGDMGWYEFNLRCLTAAYPDDKVFKDALAAELGRATDKAAADKVTPATSATTAADKPATTPADKKATGSTKSAATKGTQAPAPKGNTKGKKTAAQLAAEKDKAGPEVPGETTIAEDAAELADIK